MKRVLCLYRVSTKQQVNAEDDIPVQRRECMDFINRMPDWEFLDERLEKGVSGFKVSANKRDAILEIRQMAERKEFEVLLVFMFDRLGRREDETPFLVEWFINHGIEVWSTREGQQRIDNRGDKLMNYIRYWMAGGESEKTSMRVKAAQTQMTTDGVWRGGNVAYGYKLVHKGRIGKKNRQLYDLEIDEVDGPIVQEIFRLTNQEGLGSLRIANLLNEKYPESKRKWSRQTVSRLLQNPIYMGRMHMNDILSEPIESLRLVSDEDYAFAQYAIQKRIARKYNDLVDEEDKNVPAGHSKVEIYGATLLSGILYCAHCGRKLVGSYCTRTFRTGHRYHRPIYRCYYGSEKANQCDGQTVYSAAKIESIVITVVHNYFESIVNTVDSVWQMQAKRQLQNKEGAALKQAQNELAKLQKQQNNLRQEVLKTISGEGTFDTDILKSLLAENKVAIEAAEKRVLECNERKENESGKIQMLAEQYQNILTWSSEFDQAEPDCKKMILARLIRKITVNRDYTITIDFYITEEQFCKENSSDQIRVQEAERCDFAI